MILKKFIVTACLLGTVSIAPHITQAGTPTCITATTDDEPEDVTATLVNIIPVAGTDGYLVLKLGDGTTYRSSTTVNTSTFSIGQVIAAERIKETGTWYIWFYIDGKLKIICYPM